MYELMVILMYSRISILMVIFYSYVSHIFDILIAFGTLPSKILLTWGVNVSWNCHCLKSTWISFKGDKIFFLIPYLVLIDYIRTSGDSGAANFADPFWVWVYTAYNWLIISEGLLIEFLFVLADVWFAYIMHYLLVTPAKYIYAAASSLIWLTEN